MHPFSTPKNIKSRNVKAIFSQMKHFQINFHIKYFSDYALGAVSSYYNETKIQWQLTHKENLK